MGRIVLSGPAQAPRFPVPHGSLPAQAVGIQGTIPRTETRCRAKPDAPLRGAEVLWVGNSETGNPQSSHPESLDEQAVQDRATPAQFPFWSLQESGPPG